MPDDFQIKSVDFAGLPGFSGAFISFIARDESFMSFYPTNTALTEDTGIFSKIASAARNRSLIHSCIKESVPDGEIRDSIQPLLDRALDNRSLFLLIRSKPFFPGGPMSVLLSIVRAFELKRRLSRLYPDFEFIPLYIAEDDETDNLECSKGYIFGKDYSPVGVSCDKSAYKEDPVTIGNKAFADDILSTMEHFEALSNNNVFSTHIKSIFIPGKSWTDAFIEILSRVIPPGSMLFVKSSQLRKAGLFSIMSNLEIMLPGSSGQLVGDRSSELANAGFNISPRIFDINLCYIEGIKRYPVKAKSGDCFVINESELSHISFMDLAKYEPLGFSPRAMIKDVFINSAIPTAVNIGPPGRVASAALLNSLYGNFGVIMPPFENRFSATILMNSIFNRLLSQHQDQKAFELIFPNGAQQDRVISWLYFACELGLERLSRILIALVDADPARHHVITV